jgi:hypothetical protein
MPSTPEGPRRPSKFISEASPWQGATLYGLFPCSAGILAVVGPKRRGPRRPGPVPRSSHGQGALGQGELARIGQSSARSRRFVAAAQRLLGSLRPNPVPQLGSRPVRYRSFACEPRCPLGIMADNGIPQPTVTLTTSTLRPPHARSGIENAAAIGGVLGMRAWGSGL